ncbi:MAG TPA: hypothetical protein VGT41_02800 [Candidatus Babeliales bacterium]|nr:hypothetical protein [Candidatus Babeliales bacterium]
MNKTLFFTTIFSLSVIVSTQSFAAAPAPVPALDLLLLMDQAQTAAQVSRVLITATQAKKLPWVHANMGILFEQMRSDNQAGKLSLLRADSIVSTTVQELCRLRDGGQVARDLDAQYRNLVRKELK